MQTFNSAVWSLIAIGGSAFILSSTGAIAEVKQEGLPTLQETEQEAGSSESLPIEEEQPLDASEIEASQEGKDSQPDDEVEIDELPDILFADPNPLALPTAVEEVDVERNPIITLEQAVELAYRNSQSLQAALLTLEQASAAVDEANAARLPTVSAGANITSQENNGSVIPGLGRVGGSTIDTTLSGSVDVAYDLLTGGSRAAAIRAAQLQQQISALAVETQQEQIRLDTTNLYYALQEAGEQIRINQSFLDEAERNLRDSQLRQEVGVGTRFDVLRAEVQFANACQSLIQSQSQQRIARRDIARLLNLPTNAGVETTPVMVAETWPLTLEESIVLAFQNRAELEQQLLQSDISEQQR